MQNIKRFIKKFPLLLTITLIVIGLTGIGVATQSSSVQASDIDDLNEQLEEIEKELAQIKKDKQDLDERIQGEKSLQGTLSAQIRSLSNSISKLELDILEKETDVLKKETEIKILEEEITDARHEIQGIEKSIEELEEIAEDIIKTIYIETKTNSIVDILLLSEAGESFISQVQYHTAMGAQDQNALQVLGNEKQALEDEKKQMEEDKLEIEKLAEQIRKQKELLEKDREQLSAQKARKNTLLAQSKQNVNAYDATLAGLSDEEKKKIAEQNILIQKIFNETGNIDTGDYVIQDTIIGYEGSTGFVTGPHLHFTVTHNGLRYWGELSSYCTQYGCNPNPCNYLPKEKFDCGINGSSLIWPLKGAYSFTSGWGERCFRYKGTWHCGFHDGIDISHGYAGSPIYATHSGWIQYKTISGAKCAFICEKKNCNIGFKSGYCHMQ